MKELQLALRRVPEGPEHVIPRGMLLRGRPRVIGSVSGGGFGLYEAARSTLAWVGAPGPASLLPDPLPRVVLSGSLDFETPAWPGFRWETLEVLTRRRPTGARPASEVERLAPGFPVSRAPEGLRFSLEVGLSLGPVFVARERGEVVAVACCFWRSERHYDFSVDTLPGHRRRGLGKATGRALLRELAPSVAVHCSAPSETRARGFVRALGFRRVGAIRRGLRIDAR